VWLPVPATKLQGLVRVGEQREIIGAIDVIDDEGSIWDTY